MLAKFTNIKELSKCTIDPNGNLSDGEVTLSENNAIAIATCLLALAEENERLRDALIDGASHFNSTFSTRPCSTCELVTEMKGSLYGCNKLRIKETR